MDAGERDTRIAFEQRSGGRDGYGREKPNWAPYAAAWAAVIYGRGLERRERAQSSATLTATFNVPYSAKLAAMTPGDHRLQFDGAWDIKSIVPHRRRDGIEITAVKAADLKE